MISLVLQNRLVKVSLLKQLGRIIQHLLSFSNFLKKETRDVANEAEQSVRLPRSSSRRAQTPTPSIPHAVCLSPRKVHRNLFKNTVASSPAKEAPLSLMTKICSP